MQELIQANTDWLKQWSSSNSETYHYSLGACVGWESLIESRWPAAQMQAMATLQSADVPEPTYKELHS
jgi:hypothetical protein